MAYKIVVCWTVRAVRTHGAAYRDRQSVCGNRSILGWCCGDNPNSQQKMLWL